MKDYPRKVAPLLKGMSTLLKYAKLSGLLLLKERDKELGDVVARRPRSAGPLPLK